MKNVVMTAGQDLEIQKRISQRLYWDKRISVADVRIEAHQNVVIVKGVVDSEFKKHAALEIISSTEGVWTIVDRLAVRTNLERSDADLYAILRFEMNRLNLSPGENIQIEVRSGVVILTGRVYQTRLKAIAPSLCWELSGVRDCLNYIKLVKPPAAQDAVGGLSRLESLVQPAKTILQRGGLKLAGRYG